MDDQPTKRAWWQIRASPQVVYFGAVLWVVVLVVLIAVGVADGRWPWFQIVLGALAAYWTAAYVGTAVKLLKAH